eukprot:scaffold52888_cov70-Phaeocystis_antarctica.AAC.29
MPPVEAPCGAHTMRPLHVRGSNDVGAEEPSDCAPARLVARTFTKTSKPAAKGSSSSPGVHSKPAAPGWRADSSTRSKTAGAVPTPHASAEMPDSASLKPSILTRTASPILWQVLPLELVVAPIVNTFPLTGGVRSTVIVDANDERTPARLVAFTTARTTAPCAHVPASPDGSATELVFAPASGPDAHAATPSTSTPTSILSTPPLHESLNAPHRTSSCVTLVAKRTALPPLANSTGPPVGPAQHSLAPSEETVRLSPPQLVARTVALAASSKAETPTRKKVLGDASAPLGAAHRSGHRATSRPDQSTATAESRARNPGGVAIERNSTRPADGTSDERTNMMLGADVAQSRATLQARASTTKRTLRGGAMAEFRLTVRSLVSPALCHCSRSNSTLSTGANAISTVSRRACGSAALIRKCSTAALAGTHATAEV